MSDEYGNMNSWWDVVRMLTIVALIGVSGGLAVVIIGHIVIILGEAS